MGNDSRNTAPRSLDAWAVGFQRREYFEFFHQILSFSSPPSTSTHLPVRQCPIGIVTYIKHHTVPIDGVCTERNSTKNQKKQKSHSHARWQQRQWQCWQQQLYSLHSTYNIIY